MWMLKNSEGKKDLMATLMVISYFFVMIKVVLGGSTLSLSDWSVTIDPISAELAGVLLGTNTVGYVARRHTDKKFAAVDEEYQDEGGE